MHFIHSQAAAEPTPQFIIISPLPPAAPQEAAAARAAGREDWWKLREAVLYGVGTISDHLLELAHGSRGRGLPLDVPALMASILQVRATAGWLQGSRQAAAADGHVAYCWLATGEVAAGCR